MNTYFDLFTFENYGRGRRNKVHLLQIFICRSFEVVFNNLLVKLSLKFDANLLKSPKKNDFKRTYELKFC